MLMKPSILIDPQAFTGNQQDRWVQGRDGGVSFGVYWSLGIDRPLTASIEVGAIY